MQEEFEKAEVISVDKEGQAQIGGSSVRFQDITLKITFGIDAGKTIRLTNGGGIFVTREQLVTKGEVLILDKTQNGYLILDKYRLDTVPFLLKIKTSPFVTSCSRVTKVPPPFVN